MAGEFVYMDLVLPPTSCRWSYILRHKFLVSTSSRFQERTSLKDSFSVCPEDFSLLLPWVVLQRARLGAKEKARFFFFWCVWLFRAAPAAYGGSQAGVQSEL